MLRALYEYDGIHKGTLPFKSGDRLLLLKEETGDSNWWQVANSVGHIGFIPTSFVMKITENTSSVLSFTDKILDRVFEQQGDIQLLGMSRQKAVQKVKAARNKILLDTSPNENEATTPLQTNGDIRQDVSTINVDVCRKKTVVEMPESLGRELIELVRFHTKLNHDLCKEAIIKVLDHVKCSVPGIAPELETIIEMITDYQAGANLSVSHDAKRLKEIFRELKAVKDDEEQRSWALHEDEATIISLLEELLSILSNADTAISQYCVADENYDAVQCLVIYYQMEVRLTIRLLVLKVFGAMCALDRVVISILLCSVLPTELAREMQSSTNDIVRLNHVSLVMTMIFSSGETPPLQVFDYVNEKFGIFLLETMNNPPEADVEDQVIDIFMSVILAINLHAQNPNDSLIIKALKKLRSAKAFTEKLLLLFNRETDPVKLFDHSPSFPNSVLKMILDVLSHSETAQLFYTNDVKVLLDILVRNITDLSSEDNRRNIYLKICHLTVKNTLYSEHQHRRNDLQQCFKRILQESPPNQQDIIAIKNISQEFPHYFCL